MEKERSPSVPFRPYLSKISKNMMIDKKKKASNPYSRKPWYWIFYHWNEIVDGQFLFHFGGSRPRKS